MNKENGNGLNCASKAGIIARALLSDRKIVILLIALGLALDSGRWFIIFTRSTTSYITVCAMLFSIQQAIFASFMASLCFQRNKYIDLVMHFESNARVQSNHPSLKAYMKRNRCIFYLITFINFLINLFLAAVPLIGKIINLEVKKFDVLRFCLTQIGFWCYFTFIRFYVEVCLYTHACFMKVEHQIDTLNKSTNGLSIDGIRKVRRLYCYAVEATERFNSLLWPVIASYFVVSIANSHFAFANAISNASFTIILICVGQLSVFILVVYYMIYVNHLATRMYQSAYSLSYKADSLFAKKEVQLFLTRIERADVGFTFLDLFVITPTCVTTLATISLTIALAAPALIK